MNRTTMIISEVRWFENAVIEVEYSVFPYWYKRVAVYSFEDFTVWLNNRCDCEKGSGIEFFIDEFQSIMQFSIEEFHLDQSCVYARNENGRLKQELSRLERIVDSLVNRIMKLTGVQNQKPIYKNE